jgi:hypothetical protein
MAASSVRENGVGDSLLKRKDGRMDAWGEVRE